MEKTTLSSYVQKNPLKSFETYERNRLAHPLVSMSIVMAGQKTNFDINDRISTKGYMVSIERNCSYQKTWF